jgi:hypothetical protein
MAAALAVRERVPATRAEAATTSASSTGPSWQQVPTPPATPGVRGSHPGR